MNKNFKLSLIAATMVSTLFVGCSSNTAAGTTATAGTGNKAPLNAATVTIGGTTSTTDAFGAWSMNRPNGSTDVVISDGNYSLINGGEVYTNTLDLRAVAGTGVVKVNVLTTLIEEFKDADLNASAAQAAAFQVLQIPAGTDIDTVTEQSFETMASILAPALAALQSSSSATDLFTDLATDGNVSRAIVDGNVSDINTTILTAAVNLYDPTGATTTAAQLAKMINDNNSTTAPAKPTASEVVDLNETGIAYYIDGGSTMAGYVATSGGAMDATQKTGLDAVVVDFMLTDYSSGFVGNSNGSLVVTLTGLDDANANSSYKIALTGLDINASSNMLALNSNTDSSVEMDAISSTGAAVGIDDMNSTSTAYAISNVLGTAANATRVTVSSFIEYMQMIFDGDSSVADGNFTSGFDNGNFSAQVYVNINDEQVTIKDRTVAIIPTTVLVGKDDEHGTDGTPYENLYKVLDTNLTY